MTYDQEQLSSDALDQYIDTTEREVDDELYHIWTKKLRANFEHSLKEAVYNLPSWVKDNYEHSVDDL